MFDIRSVEPHPGIRTTEIIDVGGNSDWHNSPAIGAELILQSETARLAFEDDEAVGTPPPNP
jgi:hypothetical protein